MSQQTKSRVLCSNVPNPRYFFSIQLRLEIMSLLSEQHRKNRVGPTRSLVHVCRCNCACLKKGTKDKADVLANGYWEQKKSHSKATATESTFVTLFPSSIKFSMS